jgi:DNA-binding HxlR family transcriptional regulator
LVAIDKISKKWSKEILNELILGPKRFNELGRAIGSETQKVSSRILANRLNELEKEGIIKRKVTKSKPPQTKYYITSKGEKLLALTTEIYSL